MPIFGIGTDIVSIERIERVYRAHPERFPARILHPHELAEFSEAPSPAAFLAKRFAVKEAAAKALGTGFRDGLRYDDFVVDHNALGRPLLRCYGRAAALLRIHNVVATHLSIADEVRYALAYVILET